jgi:hypothetical protein
MNEWMSLLAKTGMWHRLVPDDAVESARQRRLSMALPHRKRFSLFQ